ncbi:MAG: hypothetical protein Ct9H300mP19_12960 [Dehalococcoidia bacterium]|nr:MAG: hypothetical protein Ct9H300mP19_12960 [Dehalococcoidia bacterium]
MSDEIENQEYGLPRSGHETRIDGPVYWAKVNFNRDIR